MEQELNAKSRQIAVQLGSLGRRIKDGDESEFLVWVIPSALACAHRPLRYHRLYGGSVRNLAAEATPLVFDWADWMHIFGIQSIICLMHETELGFYRALNLGAADLVEFYELRGFRVSHIPWEDPAHSKTPPAVIAKKLKEIRRDALGAYESLPNPDYS